MFRGRKFGRELASPKLWQHPGENDSGPPIPNTAKPQHLLRYCGLTAVYAVAKRSECIINVFFT
jgi:hypothetical protein